MDKQWRCFHCDELFTSEDAAREHFGPSIHSDPACLVDATKLRDLESRLQRYHDEDTDWHRAFYKLGSDHHQAMGRHGDEEYARGLRDGNAELVKALRTIADEVRSGAPFTDPERTVFKIADEALTMFAPVPAGVQPCARCGGTGVVDDGEITGVGGAEFTNGPIRCVTDCPDCKGNRGVPSTSIASDGGVTR